MSSPDITPEASHRSSRAMVARALINLHERNELENPEQWHWRCIDNLPVWCLLDVTERHQLQLMCGLLVNAPSIARWLDGRSIRTLYELLGEGVVEQVLEQALALSASEQSHSSPVKAELSESPSPESVAAFLLESGGSVLHCSLDSSLPIARLTGTLEGSDLVFPGHVARTVLDRAHELLPGVVSRLHMSPDDFQKTPEDSTTKVDGQ